jgi:hypothetical protein
MKKVWFWLWVRIKAMHWAAKLVSAILIVHACVLLAQAYQLKHLVALGFDHLNHVQGKLVLVKKGRNWLTGVEYPNGSTELYSCRLPGVNSADFCFMSDVVSRNTS